MKPSRSCLFLLVITMTGAGHAAPAPRARELLDEAAQLSHAGRYQAALERYDRAARAAPRDETETTRALLGAVECELALGRPAEALDRVRAAPLPRALPLRALVALVRLELLRRVGWYGYADEVEEGAKESAKLSRAAADKEMEAAVQALWADRAVL